MYNLEYSFIRAVIEKDGPKALNTFDKLYQNLLKISGGDLINIKIYLISLNGAVYQACKDVISLDDIFYDRIEFSKAIYRCINIDEISKLNRKIISSYVNACSDKPIHTDNLIVNSAIVYINLNLANDISLSKVADHVNISKSYLSTLLTKHTGFTFAKLVSDMRINKAKHLLATTNYSIQEIGEKCGFNSQSYFCSTFKKITSCSPTSFREK